MKILYKINLVPIGAAIFFIIIFIMAWFLGKRTESLLTNIESGYFPALEMSRDLESTLSDIQRSMLDASTSGDQEKLLKADGLKDRFTQLIKNQKANITLDLAEISSFQQQFENYYLLARETTLQMITAKSDITLFENSRKMQEEYKKVHQYIHDLKDAKQADMGKSFVDSRKSHRILMNVILVFTLLISAALSVGILIGRRIGRSIKDIVNIMKDIAEGEGDLTRRIKATSKDELSDLALWFNTFMNKLHEIIHQVRQNTEKVSVAVATISSTSAQMASGAEEHNAQANEVSASIEQMSSSIMQNSQNAGETAKIAETAGIKAGKGADAMQKTKQGMEAIVLSTQAMENIIKSMTDRAMQIGEITTVIDKIADQTNLLALNAAVEAARAGDQGRGFAVVADEVRKLAERTAGATKEITGTIEAIQKDTIGASESMKKTVDVVTTGKTTLDSTEKILTEIVDSVTQSVDRIQQIAASSEEQSAGAEDISSSVEEMNAVSKQTSSGAEQLSAAAQELSAQTEILQQVVNQFKLREQATLKDAA